MEVAILLEDTGAANSTESATGFRHALRGDRAPGVPMSAESQRKTRLFATFRATSRDVARAPRPVVTWQRPADRAVSVSLADSVLGISERVTTSLGAVGELSSRMIMQEAAVSAWEKALLAEDLILLGYAVDELNAVAVELRRALGDDASAPVIPPDIPADDR